MLETSFRFLRGGNENLLCHSIAVCAPLARWVANATCTNALSGWACSRNAANGKRATASPASARPSRTPEPMPRAVFAEMEQPWRPAIKRSRLSMAAPQCMVRLQKFLAEAGVASRRASERFILDGRVAVNGPAARSLGGKADPAGGKVTA